MDHTTELIISLTKIQRHFNLIGRANADLPLILDYYQEYLLVGKRLLTENIQAESYTVKPSLSNIIIIKPDRVIYSLLIYIRYSPK